MGPASVLASAGVGGSSSGGSPQTLDEDRLPARDDKADCVAIAYGCGGMSGECDKVGATGANVEVGYFRTATLLTLCIKHLALDYPYC